MEVKATQAAQAAQAAQLVACWKWWRQWGWRRCLPQGLVATRAELVGVDVWHVRRAAGGEWQRGRRQGAGGECAPASAPIGTIASVFASRM